MHATSQESAKSFEEKDRVRLFENPFMEQLTLVHFWTPMTFWSGVISYMLYQVFTVYEIPALTFFLTAISGVFIWTYCEYILHRYIFHMKAKNKFTQRIVFLFHENHHIQMNDKKRLLMPIVPAIVLSLPFYTLFYLVLGEGLSYVMFSFFMIGYLIYDYIHYSAHHFKPKTRMGKILKQNHLYHHYHRTKMYGVSSPLWDFILGTYGRESKK